VRQNLVWNKHAFILGRSDYQWKHEPCLYGWKDGAAHYFTESRNRTSVIDLAQSLTEKDIEKMKKEDMVVMLKAILALPTSVINANKPNKNTDHPTMKPLELFGELMKNSSVKGDPVLDTFGGSGTTLICAEQLKRKCYMVELDPHYCDVIIARWEKLTGKEAVKL
jgi:DNA modification methylase